MAGPVTTAYLVLAVLLGNALRGAVGIGPAIVFVSVATLAVGPRHAIASSSVLDAFGGVLVMYRNGVTFRQLGARSPQLVVAVLTALLGALVSVRLPQGWLQMAIGLAIFAAVAGSSLKPRRLEPSPCWSMAAHATAGFCGGAVGIAGPPLIAYHRLCATSGRRELMIALPPVLFVLAGVRAVIYALAGDIDGPVLFTIATLAPAVVVGVWLGDRLLVNQSETLVARVVDIAMLVLASVVLWQGLGRP